MTWSIFELENTSGANYVFILRWSSAQEPWLNYAGLEAVTEGGEYVTVGEWGRYWKWEGSEIRIMVEPMLQNAVQNPSESDTVLQM